MNALKKLAIIASVLAFMVVSGCSGMAVKSNTMDTNAEKKDSKHEFLAFDDDDENYDNWD